MITPARPCALIRGNRQGDTSRKGNLRTLSPHRIGIRPGDVEKVCVATRLTQQQRPDIPIDGPLQYDAAFMPDVAKTKATHSPVADRVTVFIFPDLNTGNTTYKAVQRSANVISIGPMLQGLKRPVNDLSRGALVDDIVYTSALTAVQASQG